MAGWNQQARACHQGGLEVLTTSSLGAGQQRAAEGRGRRSRRLFSSSLLLSTSATCTTALVVSSTKAAREKQGNLGRRVLDGSHRRRGSSEIGYRNRSCATAAAYSSEVSSSLPSPAKRLQRLEVPGLVATITPDDVLNSSPAWADLQALLQNTLDARNAGHGNGVSAVVLDGIHSENANELYEAGMQAKAVLKKFSSLIPLILKGRPDIAAACECEGVILASKDIPTVAARKILSSDTEKQQASIVIREVSDSKTARQKAEEGASALLLSTEATGGDDLDVGAMKAAQRGAASIPFLYNLDLDGEQVGSGNYSDFDGIVGDMEKLKAVAKEFMGGGDEEKENSTFGNIFCNAFLAKDEQERRYASLKVKTLEEDPATIPGEEDKTSETDSLQLKNAIFRGLLQLQAIVDAKAPKLIDGLEGNASMLITDALQALNEAILVVIVGEFNSGKSSVINALLNEQVVPVGVVPTTNEVSLIKFGQNSRMEQQEDGTFLKTIPSDMLKSMTIVDTPGTNVVLERQQKLTEDFIPKADLVLFTLSADRPLTESETKFMTFIKQWSKKLVFVVNKKELLSESEISEVCSFVKTNSSQILGLKDPPIYPVSAKLELGGSSSGEDSGFSSLLKQIRESTNGVGTGAKLKFTTALSLGQSLSNALKQQITVKEKALRKEAAVVESVSKQMKQFKREMAKDANVQYVKINKAVDSVSDATEELTDTVLSLSNVKGITSYLLGSEKVTVKPSAEILTNFESALRGSIADHKGWLLENCNQQCSYYNTFLQEKIRSLSQSDNLVSSMEVSETQVNMDLSDFMRSASSAQAEAEKAILSMSSEVLTEAYETSVTEAATTSFGTAGVALVATLVATLILNSFTEDLLALVCGSVVAYLSVLSIPLQRAKVKLIFRSKLQEEIKSLVEALKKDLETALEETDKRVAAMAVPVEEMILMEKQDVEKLKEEQSEMDSLFEDLELKVSALRE